MLLLASLSKHHTDLLVDPCYLHLCAALQLLRKWFAMLTFKLERPSHDTSCKALQRPPASCRSTTPRKQLRCWPSSRSAWGTCAAWTQPSASSWQPPGSLWSCASAAMS